MVTSISELQKAKYTWEFKAPDFPNGTPLTVELRSASIMSMMREGVISNPLLNDVQTLTEPKKVTAKKLTAAQQASAYEFIMNIVDYCVVSPTVAEIKEYAGGLTDAQIFAIYNEVMKPVTELSSFRTESTDT